MTWICLKCGNPLCWIHDGGAYCPNCGPVDVRYEKDPKDRKVTIE